MKAKTKYILIFSLLIISLISSIILTIPSSSNTCSIFGGCEKVHNSTYNYTFGIQNSYYGIIIFLFLSIITFIQIIKPTKIKRNIINIGIIGGTLIALWFIYLQRFVIGAYCQYCLVVDISVLISFIIMFLSKFFKKKS